MSFNSYILKLAEDHKICQDNLYYLWGEYYKQNKGAFLFPREMMRKVVEPYDKLDLMCMVRDANHFHLGEDWFLISGDKGREQLNSSNFIAELIDTESVFKWIDETGQKCLCSPNLYSIWEEWNRKLDDYCINISSRDGEVTIVSCVGNPIFVEIPLQVGGEPVTRIKSYAFEECYSLESVTIPNSVIEIGNRAFIDCSNLKHIAIPESVIEIGYHTFGYQCSSYGSGDDPIDGFTIKGTKGSEAERYAKDNGFRFVVI